MKYAALLMSLVLGACQTAGAKSTMLTEPSAGYFQGSPSGTQIAGMSMYDIGHAMSGGRVDIYDPGMPMVPVAAPVVYSQTMPVAPVAPIDEIEMAPVPPPAPDLMTVEHNDIILPPTTPFVDQPARRNNPDGSDYRQRPLMTY